LSFEFKKHVVAGDGVFGAVNFLVNAGLLQVDLSPCCLQNEITIVVDS